MLAALTELFITIAVATVTTLELVRELFVQISYAEFNENQANGSVTYVTSPTG
jgi:exosortase/archaeosortase